LFRPRYFRTQNLLKSENQNVEGAAQQNRESPVERQGFSDDLRMLGDHTSSSQYVSSAARKPFLMMVSNTIGKYHVNYSQIVLQLLQEQQKLPLPNLFTIR